MTDYNYKTHDHNLYQKALRDDVKPTKSKLVEMFEKQEWDNSPLTKEDGEKILEAIASLERKLELIFGDAVIIKGSIVSLGDILGKE